MPQQATIYKVLIASPSDTDQDRLAICDAILAWNQNVGRILGIVLDAIHWKTHAYPEMGDRPQAIINKQLVESCDILIGIFWTRIGTPTGIAESGSVEEIYQFIATGKPVLIYFSSIPVVLDKVDQQQYSKLIEMKEKWMSNGICFTYASLPQLREYIYNHITKIITKLLEENDQSEAVMNSSISMPAEFYNPPLELKATQAEEYRQNRIKIILSGQTSVKLMEGAKLILHIIPASSLNGKNMIDIAFLEANWLKLWPIYTRSSAYRINLDGIVTYSRSNNVSEASAYAAMSKTGSIESVDLNILHPWRVPVQLFIPSQVLELEILKSLSSYINLYREANIQSPLFISLSLTDVFGYKMAVKSNFPFEYSGEVIDTENVFLDIIQVDSYDESLDQVMKPAFDQLWNAAGWPKSRNYDANGCWIGGIY